MKHFVLAAALSALSTPVLASTEVPVDLSTWVENGNPNNGAGTWVVQSGNDAVRQTENGSPTVFHDNTDDAQGKALKGTIEVYQGGDDDFVGFVLGYSDGEINSATADFWLIDWKQGDQNSRTAGLRLNHVSGDLTNTNNGVTGDWWGQTGPVSQVAAGATLGSTGWALGQTYTFEITFTSSLIRVLVDGVEEFNYAGSFTNGSFGFYNFSQAGVEYAGITTADAPAVPLPASLPLLAAGFGAVALMKRRKKAA